MATYSFDASQLEDTRYSPIRQRNFQQAILLVVEDHEDVWALLRFALTKAFPDIRVYRTSSRQDTIAFIQEGILNPAGLPKLILQDLYLPTKEDGLGLLKDIQTLLADYQQIPTIVMSSSINLTDIQQAYHFHASYYVVKPINMNRWLDFCQSLRQFWWDQGILPFYTDTDQNGHESV
ncbi:response regulator [Spirosoma sp. KNUC1025]|uniref:response regulator n=1 Tax=Spirosoma sp. KNUC1025 TaxID=2894082 RepID=UPI0038641F7F|nr:response regulator [Spirosoma sp. KNUC1025]